MRRSAQTLSFVVWAVGLVALPGYACGGGSGGGGAGDAAGTGGVGQTTGTGGMAGTIGPGGIDAGGDTRGDAGVDAGNCPAFGQVTIWQMCTTCHSITVTGAGRNLAPDGVNFDVYESAFANAEIAQSYVLSGFMPPPTEPQPTPTQRESLNMWIACGKPR